MIQWFPGHMTKALREMQEEVKNIDALLYVVDSRAPSACINPKFCALCENKSVVYIFNKFDLCDSVKVKTFSQSLKSKNSACVFLDSTKSNSSKQISSIVSLLCKDKIEKAKAKGLNRILKCMVIGVPNSGKSTLINNLSGYGKTITGNKPGVTKGKQWVKISPFLEVLDTPGTLWPAFENQNIANSLAFIGSVKDDIVDKMELAISLLMRLKTEYPTLVSDYYQLGGFDDSEIKILERIAELKKCILKGGEVDLEKTASMLINDFRKGKLGKITFL